MRTLGTLIITFALCGQAWAGPLEDAKTALDSGDTTTAIQLLRPLAEQGAAIAKAEGGK